LEVDSTEMNHDSNPAIPQRVAGFFRGASLRLAAIYDKVET
jgi:hypothetical protein